MVNNTPDRQIPSLKFKCRHYFRKSKNNFRIKNLGWIKNEESKTPFGDVCTKVINLGNQAALADGFDYTCVMSADVLLPNVAIAKMMAGYELGLNVGVVCITCYYRSPGLPEPIPMVVPLKDENKTEVKLDSIEYFKNPFYHAEAGNGAMISPRSVIKKIKWRAPRKGSEDWGNDYQYCIDVKEKLDLITIIRTDIECFHLDDETGQLFYSSTGLKGCIQNVKDKI